MLKEVLEDWSEVEVEVGGGGGGELVKFNLEIIAYVIDLIENTLSVLPPSVLVSFVLFSSMSLFYKSLNSFHQERILCALT